MNLILRIKQIANQHFDAMVANRRHLHRNPELSFEEFATTKFIAEKLKETGYDLQTITETGGYIDIIGKNHSSKVIALRGDIDDLPILEKNEVEYKSQNEGKMHACGHDVHTTSLLGAVRILHELREEFEGTIRCIFQP